MKKKIGLALIMVFLAGLVLNSRGHQRGALPVEFKKISDRLYEVTGGQGASGG